MAVIAEGDISSNKFEVCLLVWFGWELLVFVANMSRLVVPTGDSLKGC